MSRTNERHSNKEPTPGSLVPPLLDWFAKNAREMPWRRTSDPYAIWVSEIMLQQTQVKTVIPYWERWMKALPDVASLAKAKPEKIHKLWEGLGYYTRVRNMQKAAVEILSKHNGAFPRSFEDILELPGIGRYTAGAIASIAFNEPRPILDGNVIRVLTRVYGIAGDPREKTTNEKLWRLAQELVDIAAAADQNGRSRREEALIPFRRTGEVRDSSPRLLQEESRNCSHLNQSLMELGATVCTPTQPKCLLCPVRPQCAAFRTGRVTELPNITPRAAVTSRRFVAFVVEHRGRYLVRQRPAAVVNAHLWEFPNVEVTGGNYDAAAIATNELSLAPSNLKKLCTIKHSITRYRITLEVFAGKTNGRSPKAVRFGKWLNREHLNALAFASAHRKILERLTE